MSTRALERSTREFEFLSLRCLSDRYVYCYSFVCAHFTAHEPKLAQRIADYHHIVRSLLFAPLPGTSTTSPSTIYSTSTYTDSPDTPDKTDITNMLYTTIPSYTTSDHVRLVFLRILAHLIFLFLQKPIVSLLLLPPSSPSISSPSETIPLLQHHPDFSPDRYATLKRYTGRTLDRIIGVAWLFLVVIGAGNAAIGVGNCLLGIGAWTWWKEKSSQPTEFVASG